MRRLRNPSHQSSKSSRLRKLTLPQRGLSPMPVMAHHDSALWVASLQVYKDGRLVDTVHLQGHPERWFAGRHADCDICVGHASISRRHLQIQVLHATQELLLVDLHSAHGTRVNGEALTPGSPYPVKQGDTVQMGASTRSYKVDWVPSMAVDQQASEAAASVLERSLPNGSKTSFRYKLGDVQGAKKKPAKDGISKDMTKSVSSPTRVQGQRGRRPELPPRTPTRRVPFANVQATALNKRSPQGLPLKKAATLPEKLTPSKVIAGLEDRRIGSTAREVRDDVHDGSRSPDLWLWRCRSAPVPTLLTAGGDSCALDENEVEILPVFSRECSGEGSRSDIPGKSSSAHGEYPSDKENWEPGNTRTGASWDGRQSWRSPNQEEDRRPFAGSQADSKSLQPLFSSPSASSPDSDIGPRSRTSGLRPPQQPSSSALVNNLDSLFGKLKLGGELRCQWHVVVDTNCLLDTDALKSLKQLEGIRETRIIVPRIVLRELDGLKRRHDIGHSARMVLKWIEDCMERIPFWMHVQTSTETPPARRPPPSSPARFRSISVHRDQRLMPHTNDDHILDCALLFACSVADGRVVLLTRDTALKIKAMAEGLNVEDATSFSESLLSPYSERFLWLGSTAYLPPVKALSSRLQFTGYDESYAAALSNSPSSASNSELCSNKKLFPGGKGHGKHGVAEFRCHYSERYQGLQVVLT